MLSAIPANEMAETLRVLIGANAENAARHFGNRSFDAGDVAAAILWTNVAGLLGHPLGLDDEADGPPVPLRMRQVLEAAAFEGVRYEDVDGDILIQEALMHLLEVEKKEITADVHLFPDRVAPAAAYTADGTDDSGRLPLAA